MIVLVSRIANAYRDEMEPNVKHRVQFQLGDAITADFPKDFYDVVYSSSVILHIEDKLTLFQNMFSALKPGDFL